MEFKTLAASNHFHAYEDGKSIDLKANDTHIEIRINGIFIDNLSFDSLLSLLYKNNKITKINLGTICIPESYTEPYCFVRPLKLYLCADNTLQKGGDKHQPYYHKSREALLELLDKYYEYTLES